MDNSLNKDNPLLLPLNREETVFDGFITVKGRDFRMRISLPPDKQLKLAKVHCCWQLKHLLRGYERLINQRLQHSESLNGFILELKTILEVGLKKLPESRSILRPQYYTQLISEMETLGWDKGARVLEAVCLAVEFALISLPSETSGCHAASITAKLVPAILAERPQRMLSIDMEFQTLKLKAEDSSGRQHVLAIKLKAKHPTEAPECSADLPIPLTMSWRPEKTLDQLHSQFLLVLETLKDFWDALDEIDAKTWILEPEKPSRSDTMRRIAIGNNAFIKIEVNPRHPRMLPECCLLGAEHSVSPLRKKLNSNMHLWNPDSSVFHNLQDVLEIEFPSPATHEKSSFSSECGICYSYRLDGDIPDQMCNEPRCGQPFHRACLYEWLRALPSSRQSFSVIFGECPYCSKPITVKTLL